MASVTGISLLLSEDAIHLRSADRTSALGRSSAIRQLDFLPFEITLVAALHAIAVEIRHGPPRACVACQRHSSFIRHHIGRTLFGCGFESIDSPSERLRRKFGAMPSLSTEQVIDALSTIWDSILDATDGLKESSWDLPTDCPGWDVSDQLAHLIGIELLLLGEPIPEVELGARDYIKNKFGESIEAWIEVRRPESGKTLRKEFMEVTQRRLEMLRSLPEEAFDAVGWSPIGQVPMRKFMEIRAMDCWVHEQDMRVALGRPGGRNGVGEQITLGRADAALGGVVAGGMEAGDGTSLAIEVVGPLGGRRRIEVIDGKGSHVAGESADATVTLSQEIYERRFCGRISAAEVEGDPQTEFAGDMELGRAFVEALAVMI